MRRKFTGLSIKLMLIAVIFLAALPASAHAEDLLSKYNGLMANWHKAKICMPCHINTLPLTQLDEFSKCTPCHNPKLDMRDPQQVEKLHTVNICIKCHVGSTYNSKNLGLKVHEPHKKIQCSKCHGSEAPFSVPSAKLCNECHGSNPHSVHSKILNDVCTYCHSENIKDYFPAAKEVISAAPQPTPTEEKEPESPKITSISDLIFWILNLFF
ncbi:cytochrome c3 family protein [Geoglobus acetivorans]|uniref:Cytochrome c7-like domain-containing protein n=1 Tax=Geoglobus acetivorans TaxID=565033 RepID=A0ABZ3H3E9_GEOAI|nr:hypothetical protein [Geoglobus acetivorans]